MGEPLSVEKIYAHIMEELGFSNVQIRAIRKRNSKKELIELTWCRRAGQADARNMRASGRVLRAPGMKSRPSGNAR